jgi:hypothetical protein
MSLEFALFAIAIWTYQRRTRAKDKIGLYAFAGFVAVLLLAYAGASLGPAPSSVKKLAIVTLLTVLAIPWAWWFDKHREVVWWRRLRSVRSGASEPVNHRLKSGH